MNVATLLFIALGGAAFSSHSFLQKWELAVPYSDCSPLVLKELPLYHEKLSLERSDQSLVITPLSSGEVELEWSISCSQSHDLLLEWQLDEASFQQGVFWQTERHAQFLDSIHNMTLIKVSPQETITGRVKFFCPQELRPVALRFVPSESIPLILPSFTTFFSWKISLPATHQPSPYEVRSAVTSYHPRLEETSEISCQTFGDLFSRSNKDLPHSCYVSSTDQVAIETQKKLFATQETRVTALSQAEVTRKPALLRELVITEVMWPGTYLKGVSLGTDQWLEIYNNTDESLELLGVKILGAKPVGEVVFLNSTILPARTAYIIGNAQNDKTSLRKNPDRVTQISFLYSGGRVQLYSSSNVLLDETPSGPWTAGENDMTRLVRSSLQRRWLDSPGSQVSSWGDCSQGIAALRCHELSRTFFRSNPGENLATPWQLGVL